MKLNALWVIGSWMAVATLVGGCEVSGRQKFEFHGSVSTIEAFKKIGAKLQAEGAEVQVDCDDSIGFFATPEPYCILTIDGSRDPKLDAQVIPEPFTNKPMLLRLTNGTEAFRGGLYEALGEQGASTNDFQGSLDERKLQFESNKIKLRCVATREAVPQHQCWTLISADLLK